MNYRDISGERRHIPDGLKDAVAVEFGFNNFKEAISIAKPRKFARLMDMIKQRFTAVDVVKRVAYEPKIERQSYPGPGPARKSLIMAAYKYVNADSDINEIRAIQDKAVAEHVAIYQEFIAKIFQEYALANGVSDYSLFCIEYQDNNTYFKYKDTRFAMLVSTAGVYLNDHEHSTFRIDTKYYPL